MSNKKTKEAVEGFFAVTLALVVFIVLLVTTLAIEAWVLQNLWFWFIHPIFEFRPLTVLECVAIMLVVKYVQHSPSSCDEDNKGWVGIIRLLTKPFVFLLLGYIVHLMMRG